MELYLVFFLCYLVLVPLQVYAAMRQHHPVTRLFTASLILEFLALCLILLHVLKFSLDGSGFQQLAVAGDILDILSRVRNWSMKSSRLLLYILLLKVCFPRWYGTCDHKVLFVNYYCKLSVLIKERPSLQMTEIHNEIFLCSVSLILSIQVFQPEYYLKWIPDTMVC